LNVTLVIFDKGGTIMSLEKVSDIMPSDEIP
jgi:hypothetical protein